MGIATKLLIGVASVVIIAVLVLGYFGFVPGVSDALGANTPRDLGVRPTAADLESVNAKLGVTYSTLPNEAAGTASLIETGSHPMNVQLTSEEATALLNDHASKWKYYPIDHIQVKVNPDNTVEVSGVLRVDRWKGFADAIELPESTRSQVRPYLSYVMTNPSIYLKGTLSIHSPPEVTVTEAEVGRMTFTGSALADYLYDVAAFISYVARLNGLQITTLEIYNGFITVVGVAPNGVALSPP